MSEIIYGMDGHPAGEFVPEKPTNEQGRVLMSVPTNPNITGFIETVEPSADIFRGKHFSYIDGPFLGTKVIAQKMIKEGQNYFVILDNGQRVPVKDFQRLLIEIEQLPEDFGNIKPNTYNNGLGDFKHTNNKPVVFDPVIEILKKRRKKPTTLSLSLSLDIPSKELYEVLIDDYDNAEEKLIEFLFTPENIILFKDSVKESLRKYYDIIPEHN